MKLYLLRHAERGCGAEQDTLTKEGIKQAKKTAKYFKNIKIDKIISGNLNRTRKTSEEILKIIKCPIKYTSLVDEQSMGIFRGKSLEEYKKALQESGLSEDEFRPPEGENRYDAYNRAEQFVKQLKKETIENLIVVSCSGFIVNLITLLLKLSKKENKNLKIPFCSISYFELDKEFNIVNSDLNNTTHLK